jgi:predicted lipoprotein with Yx(FWY)xxD motif
MSISMPGRVPVPARLGLGLAAALLAAACGSSASTSSTPPASGSAAGGASSASGGNLSGSTVITTASTSAGTVLTDGSGKAVYLWSKDSGGKSTCDGTCLGAWPAVTATGTVTTAGGAQSGDLGTFKRSDGTMQVTYMGHPLYYYAGDSGPGTASGQGSDQFGGKWYLVSPAGADVTAAVTSFMPGKSGSGSGSGSSAPAAPPTSKSAGGGWS